MKNALFSLIASALLLAPASSWARSVECNEEMQREISAGYDFGQTLLQNKHEIIGELIAEIVAKSSVPKAYVGFKKTDAGEIPSESNEQVAKIVKLLADKQATLDICIRLQERRL